MRAADGTGSCCASPGRSARGSRRPSMRRRTGQAPAAAKRSGIPNSPMPDRAAIAYRSSSISPSSRCDASPRVTPSKSARRDGSGGQAKSSSTMAAGVAQRIEILPEIRRDPHLPLPCPIGLLMCATTPIDYSDRLFDGPRCRNGRQPHPFERCTARCCSAARRATAQRRVRAAHHGFSTPFICTTVRRFSAADTASRQHQRQTDAGRYGEPHVTKPRFIRTAAAVATLARAALPRTRSRVSRCTARSTPACNT